MIKLRMRWACGEKYIVGFGEKFSRNEITKKA
jgi:hypothetical protein